MAKLQLVNDDVGDDRPQINIDGPVTINEDAGTVEYTVNLDKASDVDTKVTVAFEDIDTDTDDIVSKTLPTTIPAGQTEGTVSVVLDDNTIYEGPEDYKLTVQEGKDADGNVIATVNPAKESVTTTIYDDGTTDGNPVDPNDPRVGTTVHKSALTDLSPSTKTQAP